MSDTLCIQIDTLRCGDQIQLDEKVNASFLCLDECDELKAVSEITVCGKFYRVDRWIGIDARVSVVFCLPCALCNESFECAIELPQWVHEEEIAQLSKGQWDVREPLREAILVEVPFFAQCGGSKCGNFGSIQQFVRSEDGETPFKDLDSIIQLQ